MNWIIGGVIAVVVLILALCLGKAAGPGNTRERIIDDFTQLEALHGRDSEATEMLKKYIEQDSNRTITSGCPVKNNK